MFCFILPDDNPLSIHHLVYEKGPIEFPPWIVDDGQDKDGYMSITNLSAMFIYLEEKYTCDFIADGSQNTWAKAICRGFDVSKQGNTRGV